MKSNKKKTIEEVREYIKDRGYTLLSKEYTNNKTKLLLVCPNGCKLWMHYNSFSLGHRCPICTRKAVGERCKKSYADIKEYIESYRYKLLSKVYINSGKRLLVQCPEGHQYKVVWGDFKGGHRCGACNETHKKTIEEVREFLATEKYILLSKEYINSKTKLNIMCPRGHLIKMTWNGFHRGNRCIRCYNEVRWKIRYKGGISKLNIPWYDTLAHRISWIEDTRRSPDNPGYLQVRCKLCNKWFTPKETHVRKRMRALEDAGGNNFYCSDECRKACPIFGQIKYPKGFKKNNNRPSDYAVWADLIKERDGHICQLCGETENVNAHHFEGLNVNDMQSLDLDMGITLCDGCHYKAHSQLGCRFVDLQKRNVC